MSGNTSIAGFVVPADYKLGPAAIQARHLRDRGAPELALSSRLGGGASTLLILSQASESLVWSNYADDNSRICPDTLPITEGDTCIGMYARCRDR